uniref:SERTA domain-containing protein n=1 Tax=Sphenodon punctatus TaxID=8508 RepID=A0A8D0HU88_SPHPU
MILYLGAECTRCSRRHGAMFSKGVKRKRSEAEMDSPGAPSSSLFSLSLSKLHRSLQHVEPDLRPLVLVANTLRRIQDEMQSGPTAGAGPQGSPCPTEPPHSPPDGCRTLPPLDPQGEEVLLSNLDASLYASISTTLEDLSPLEGLGASPQLEELPATAARPEPDRTSPPCLGPLELLGPSGYLLEDSLEEDIFEDIDTSMYDSDQWPPAKACPGPGEGEGGQPDLSDLDYLMDVLVGAQN